PVQFPHEPQAVPEREFADQTPDAGEIARRPRHAEPGVQVKREWPQFGRRDARGFEAEVALIRLRRRQQEAELRRDADAGLLLEHAFPEDAFYRQGGIDQIQLAARTPEDREFPHRLPVLEEAVVEDDPRNGERGLAFGVFEREVAELDLHLLRIGY